YAAELDDGSIAGALDYPTPMDCDGWIDQIAAQRPQPRQSAILIRTGKPAESNHICRQDSREFPLFGHYLYSSSTTIPITRPYRMRKFLCISLVIPDRFKSQTANLLNQMGTSEKVPAAFLMMRFCPPDAGQFAND